MSDYSFSSGLAYVYSLCAIREVVEVDSTGPKVEVKLLPLDRRVTTTSVFWFVPRRGHPAECTPVFEGDPPDGETGEWAHFYGHQGDVLLSWRRNPMQVGDA